MCNCIIGTYYVVAMHPKDKILQFAGIRNNSVVYHINNGYYFTKHQQDSSRVYLRCARRESCQCRASMPLSEEARTMDSFISYGQHSHEPDFTILDFAELRRAILQRCREEDTDYRTIFDEECSRFPKHISSQLSFQSLTSSMYRERRALKESILRCFPGYDGEMPKKAVKRKNSPRPDKKKKVLKEGGVKSNDTATSSGDNNSSFTPNNLSADSEQSPLGRNKDKTPCVKEEEFKEELMLEDYGGSQADFEDTNFDEVDDSVGENTMEDDSTVHPSTSQEVPVPFETVICDSVVQVKQEIIEDETDQLRPEPDADSGMSKSTVVSETVVQNTTDVRFGGFTRSTGKLDSLNALARLTSTVGSKGKPSDQISRGRSSLGYPTPEQTVLSSQPLAVAANAPNYFGSIKNSYMTTTNHSVAITANYSAATTTGSSLATTTDYTLAATADTNPPVSRATNAPGQPPNDVPSPHIPEGQDFEGVFISMKKVPMERRKKTKDKLLRLVKLITELDLDPDEVSFSVTTK